MAAKQFSDGLPGVELVKADRAVIERVVFLEPAVLRVQEEPLCLLILDRGVNFDGGHCLPVD